MTHAAMTRVGAITWLFALPIAATAEEPVARLPVQLIVTSGLPRATVSRALDVTSRVYRRIGAEIVWVDDITSIAQPAGPDQCCLWRRVVIRSTASLEFPSAYVRIAPALGITPRNTAHPGHTVYTFVDSMLSVARARRVSVATLLGYVIAHELGHSLDGGHTTGVMRAAWTETDFTMLKQETLAFQPEQARLIRAFVGNAPPGS
jgi:hypothetical protein